MKRAWRANRLAQRAAVLLRAATAAGFGAVLASACARPTAPPPAAPAPRSEPAPAPAAESLPPLTPEEEAIQSTLLRHLRQFGETIGERNAETPWELASASDYIVDQFEASGYAVVRHGFELHGAAMQTLEAAVRGGDLGDQVVVVGAHYDSATKSKGADDNATGIAALLTLAELMRDAEPRRAIRLVAFAAGAPPYAGTTDMGSLGYARRLAEDGVKLVAMLNLDSLGAYSTAPNSQRRTLAFAPPLPREGNFVAVVGDAESLPLAQTVASAFEAEGGVPAKPAMLTEALPELDSDHLAFRQLRVPAVLVTDLRALRAHAADDTLEHVDVMRLVRVVDRLAVALETVANPDIRTVRPRPEPAPADDG